MSIYGFPGDPKPPSPYTPGYTIQRFSPQGWYAYIAPPAPAPVYRVASSSATRAGSHPASKPAAKHTAPAPSIFDPWPGPEVDAARTIVQDFISKAGWPSGVDANQLTLAVLQNNLVGTGENAYEWLYSNRLNDAQRQAAPWTRFGLDHDTFQIKLSGLQNTFKSITGMDVNWLAIGTASEDEAGELQLMLQDALKGNWSQSDIMTLLQSGQFTDIGGTSHDLSQLLVDQPWLTQGQTFQTSQQQFTSLFGAPPASTSTLAAWFRFNRGEMQLAPGQKEAITSAAKPVGATQQR